MERLRATNAALVLLTYLLGLTGCANLRLPAIDPSGQNVFLPNPNYTTLAQDGPLSRVLHRRSTPAPTSPPGPYQPAFQHPWRNRGTGGNAIFQDPPEPPLCGPDGNAPDGGPCFPIGSPSEASLQATLPPAAPIGSGVPGATTVAPWAPVGQLTPRLQRLGPAVVLPQTRYFAPVGEEVVIVGGVQSTSGVMRPGEPVRWSLSNDSAGTIVDVANAPTEDKVFRIFSKPSAPAGKACGNCVASVTSGRCYTLARNPASPHDDIRLTRGQTWVSLTSGSEGTSYVTLAAPGLPSGRQATASIVWVDAELQYPRPVINSVDSPAQLVARVIRRSDRTPLSGWIVRFNVLADGSAGRLNEAGDQTLSVITDDLGRAVVNVHSTTGQPGTTRVSIEFIKPAQPGAPAMRVGQNYGYVTWSESEPRREPALPPSSPFADPPATAPLDNSDTTPPPADSSTQTPPANEPQPTLGPPILTISADVPTQSRVGAQVPFRVTVQNVGDSLARDVRLTTRPDLGTRFIESTPRPSPGAQGGITWLLGDIPAGGAKTMNATFQFAEPGQHESNFRVDAQNAQERFDRKTTRVEQDPIAIRISDPVPFNPRVNDTVTFEIQVTNNTAQPITADLNVKYDAGLEPEAREREPGKGINREDLTIPARDTVSVPLTFTALQVGTFTHRAQLLGYDAFAEGTVRVAPAVQAQDNRVPRLKINITSGPRSMKAGTTEKFTFSIVNESQETVRGVSIDYRSTADLYVARASWQPQTSEDGLVQTWRIDAPFQPDDGVELELWLKASDRPAVKIPQNLIRVSSELGLEDQGYLDLEIVEAS